MEDKKCRICGFADLANPNIFQSNSKLAEKIVAVYPIVLYPNDPLPKHICKKCLLTTSTMYADIERFVRIQNKWISNVRAGQPDNNYIKVVDSIEGANRQTSKIVSLVAGEKLGERTICNLFNFNFKGQDNSHTSNKSQSNLKPDNVGPSEKCSPSLVNMEQDSEQISVPIPEQSVQTPPNMPPSKITQIKSALELNGCTLTKLKLPTKPTAEPDLNEVQIKVEIKEEPLALDDMPSEHSVFCKMCTFSCETVEELAIHQLNHLTLSIPKLTVRRFLDKRIRRGRLIKLSEKKCIRCLNCWRIFVDNKSILHHWSTGDCDFFCQVCGKEFATNPKMLREHVPAAHGISFKSSKLLRKPIPTPKKIFEAENSPQKADSTPNKNVKGNGSSEALSVKVACNICLKVFANFKARNSHMRAHKNPPVLPAQLPPSLADTLLAFKRNSLMGVKKEPQDYDDIPYHIVTTPSSHNKVVPPLPVAPLVSHHPHYQLSSKAMHDRQQKSAYRVTSPPKIRTKYVQVRPGPKSITFKTEPKSSSPVLKVKSLIDLQDPSVSSQQPEDPDKLSLHMTTSVAPQSNGILPTTNGLLGKTPKDSMNYGQIFNCHPCRGKFSSKLELFRHKRKCTANNLFPCQFCSRHFLTSADLQMHIMLLHKNSCPQ